jgi:hypothetical protein
LGGVNWVGEWNTLILIREMVDKCNSTHVQLLGVIWNHLKDHLETKFKRKTAMNTIRLQEEELFAKWKTQDNWVKDGAVDPDFFTDSNPKVLYLLKEANGGKDENWKGGDLRCYLNNDAARWQTWNTVARWQYAIAHLKEDIDWNKVDRISTTFRKTLLKNAVVINLKKVPGDQQSNMKEIKVFAQRDKDFIKEQISIYKPHIVICGGTGNIVKELGLLGSFSKWDTSSRGVEYCIINNTTILNYKHPGVRTSKKKLFWDVAHTLREV